MRGKMILFTKDEDGELVYCTLEDRREKREKKFFEDDPWSEWKHVEDPIKWLISLNTSSPV